MQILGLRTFMFTVFFLSFISLLFLTGCETFPTGQNQFPAPVERYDTNVQVSPEFQAQNLQTAKVALLLPLSGSRSNIGENLMQAAQLALIDTGYDNLMLMPFDTQGTANGAQNAAQQAVQAGAQLVLGPVFADAVRTAKPVIQGAEINMIAFTTDASLADRSTFIMGLMPTTQTEEIADYAASRGMKKFAVLNKGDDYGDRLTRTFVQSVNRNGGEILNVVTYDKNDPTFTTKLQTLKSGEPDAIFMPLGGQDAESASAALSAAGMLPSLVRRLGTGLWDDSRIATGPNLQGGWLAVPSPRARQQFERKYTQTYNTQPLRLNTLAYDATALAVVLARQSIQRTGRPVFERSAITAQDGFIGADGVFRFRPNGIVERNLAILELRQGRLNEVRNAKSGF